MNTLTTSDYVRPDLIQWQKDQGEYFNPTLLEIVSEYAEWRDKQPSSRQPANGLVEQCAKVVDEMILGEFPDDAWDDALREAAKNIRDLRTNDQTNKPSDDVRVDAQVRIWQMLKHHGASPTPDMVRQVRQVVEAALFAKPDNGQTAPDVGLSDALKAKLEMARHGGSFVCTYDDAKEICTALSRNDGLLREARVFIEATATATPKASKGLLDRIDKALAGEG